MASYLIFCVGLSFTLPYLQQLLPLSSRTIEETALLLRTCLPAMTIRVLNDNIKYYLRGQAVIKEFGLRVSIAFLFFLGYSYLLMEHYNLKVFGYGLSLVIYEISYLLCALYCYFRVMDPRARNTSFPLTRNICKHFHEGLNVLAPLLLTWGVE